MPKAAAGSLSSSLSDRPDDERTASQAADHALNERQSQGTLGKMGEVRGLDADREHVDPDRPIANDEIEIAAVQAAFAREITAEIKVCA